MPEAGPARAQPPQGQPTPALPLQQYSLAAPPSTCLSSTDNDILPLGCFFASRKAQRMLLHTFELVVTIAVDEAVVGVAAEKAAAKERCNANERHEAEDGSS